VEDDGAMLECVCDDALGDKEGDIDELGRGVVEEILVASWDCRVGVTGCTKGEWSMYGRLRRPGAPNS
jgi:hypothetical protein